MAKSHRIDTTQLVILLVICRLFSLISYFQSNWDIEKGSAGFVGIIVGSILTIFLVLPVLQILKNGDNILTITQKSIPKISKIICGVYWFTFILYATDCVSHFTFFMTTAAYPNAQSYAILLPLLLCVGYFASLGIEPIARANVLFAVFISLGALTITVVLFSKIEFVNFITPFYNGVTPILETALIMACRNAGALAILVLAGNAKGNLIKSYIWYVLIIMALGLLFAFLTITVLGNYAATKPFAVYTLAAVAGLDFVKRLDSIHLYVWVFSALIKASVYIFLAQVCLEKIFTSYYKMTYLIINVFIVGVGATFVLKDINYTNYFYNFMSSGVSQLVILYFIPLIIVGVVKYKQRKKPRKEVES